MVLVVVGVVMVRALSKAVDTLGAAPACAGGVNGRLGARAATTKRAGIGWWEQHQVAILVSLLFWGFSLLFFLLSLLISFIRGLQIVLSSSSAFECKM